MTYEKFLEQMAELEASYNHFVEVDEMASACHLMDLMNELQANYGRGQ